VSPCFRGDTPDSTHSNWFMKLELFAVVDAVEWGSHHLEEEFILDASKLFKYLLAESVGDWAALQRHGVGIFSTCTDIGVDIMARLGQDGAEELELGSYGVREIDGNVIAYGTGVALPRLSLAIEKHKELYNGRVP
jgi:hypothetical protein